MVERAHERGEREVPVRTIKSGLISILAIVLLAGSAVGVTAQSEEGIHVVAQDGSGDFLAIAEAVEAASDGDTILVRPGTYEESVLIDKDITLSGDGPVEDIVIEAPEGGPTSFTGVVFGNSMDAPYAVLLMDTEATLTGLTFRGEAAQVHANGGAPVLEGLVLDSVGRSVPGQFAGGGLNVTGGTTATIRGNTLTDGGNIQIYDYSEPLIEGNTLAGGPAIIGNPGPGAVIRGNAISRTGSGIMLLEPTTALIEANTISDLSATGIWVFGYEVMAPVVRGNSISGTRVGINVESGASGTIEDNALSGNDIGILLDRADVTVEDNSIEGGITGIMISGGGPPSLIGNIVDGASSTGIAVGNGTPTLSGNTVCGSETNLLVGDDAAPVLEDNDICEDLSEATAPDRAEAAEAVVTAAEQLDERTVDLTIDSPSVGEVKVRLLLPASFDAEAEARWPVLYLLHGAWDDYTSWTRETDVADLTADLDLLVVMPDAAEEGWYSDWWNGGEGGQPAWETFHLSELSDIIERDWRAGDERIIAGLSMGGFGAMHYATAHPEVFRAVAAFSGVLDPVGSGFDGGYLLWGDRTDQADVWAAHDPVGMAAALEGKPVYVSWQDGQPGPLDPPEATFDDLEAWVAPQNEAFVARLEELGIPVTVETGPGTHTWPYWQQGLHHALPILLEALEE
jgi:diacylglycerol O-acyltransferase/trehalose O-mycolyltransferase